MSWWSETPPARLPKAPKKPWHCDSCGMQTPAHTALCIYCGLTPQGFDPALGCHLSHYQIVQRVQGGLRNVVYQARDQKTEQLVALKVLHPKVIEELGGGPQLRSLLQHWRHFSHPSAPKILRSFEAPNGALCWVSPWLKGIPLNVRMRTHPEGLPIEQTYVLMHDLCDLLQAYHRQGLVHGQLRPEQLFLFPDKQPSLQLSDLGWGPRLGEYFIRHQSRDEGTLRALRFLAPEQLLSEISTVDASADVYTCGALLFYTLTGRTPFTGTRRDELLRQQLYAPPPRLNMASPHRRFDRRLEQVIRQAMAKHPQERYPSIQDLWTAFSALDLQTAIHQTRPSPSKRHIEAIVSLSSLPTAEALSTPPPSTQPSEDGLYIGRTRRSLLRLSVLLLLLFCLSAYWLLPLSCPTP